MNNQDNNHLKGIQQQQEIDPKEREQRAQELFDLGYNCSQAVVLTFSDILDIDPKKLEMISCGLGGGVGRMREVCGAMSATAMLSGILFHGGSDGDSASSIDTHHTQKTAVYTLVQQFAEQFKAENGGSIVCRELLGLSGVKVDGPGHPQPAVRDADYRAKRPCREIVGSAARMIAEKLQSQ